MKNLVIPWQGMDLRAGYQREEDDKRNAPWFCECGARVVHRFGEYHHAGPCSIDTEIDAEIDSKHT